MAAHSGVKPAVDGELTPTALWMVADTAAT
jgi:hypothetical protein